MFVQITAVSEFVKQYPGLVAASSSDYQCLL